MKRRFVFDGYGMVEVTAGYEAPRKRRGPAVISDVEPFQVPGTKEVLSSRSQIREYEKRHEVRACGNDWTGSKKPPFWDELTKCI